MSSHHRASDDLEPHAASGLWNLEDILRRVLVPVFGVGVWLFVLRVAPSLERIWDIFEEYQAKNKILIIRRVHIPAQLVRRLPKLRVKSRICPVLWLWCLCFLFRWQACRFH
jgi:hypothetical protein